MTSIPAIRRPLSPRAREWLAGLPAGIMMFTENNFPHIVEKFEQAWGRPGRMQHLRQELVFQDRPGRQGFPFEVANEIADVFDYYDQLSGSQECVWGTL